ncbi:MAG TPA: trypsin-like serine protease [Solirubrobacterales bacterium]|nr:trypsin-like serine protease [Solirubrobacterales bacterium]
MAPIALIATPSPAWAAVQPRSASIGGQPVPSPREAPWSVLLAMNGGASPGSCSGSIVDATHVVTAAHCTFDGGAPRALGAYAVVAGIADVSQGADHSEEQEREVSSVRVAPGFVPGQVGDDLAVLGVEPPFDLSAGGVAAIPLVDQNAGQLSGGAARLFGWGQIEAGRTDGRLHRLDQGLLEQWQCTYGVPSVLCAWSASGAACPGDSGGGLVSSSDPPVLLGVSSFVIYPSSACAAGNLTAYTDLSTGEIHSWLLGDDDPPQAPRADARPLLHGELWAGGTASCDAPEWSGGPALTTKFLYTSPGTNATQVAQQGPSSKYALGPKDVGHSLSCVSVAANDAGTTEAAALRPVLIGGRATELVKVREARRAGDRWQVLLSAAPSLRGRRLKAKWMAAATCEACPRLRSIAIGRRTQLVSPPLSRDGQARLSLRLPALTVGGVPYRGSTLRVRIRPLGLARGREASPMSRHVGEVR